MDEQNSVKSTELKAKLKNLQNQIEEIEALQRQEAQLAGPTETILKWQAPDRVIIPRSRLWYTGVVFGFMLGFLVAILTQEWLLIMVLAALSALVYLSYTIKPKLVTHEITNKGFITGDTLYPWRKIDGFWLSRKEKHTILIIDLDRDMNPNRLVLPLGRTNPKQMVSVLSTRIPYFTRKEIGEDLLNIFTIGTYQPLSIYLERDGESESATERRVKVAS